MNKNAYAKYELLPNIPYKIFEYLLLSESPKAELFWKLVKYNDADAYLKPNLTREEKGALIYNGGEHPEDYCLFMDFSMDDATNLEKTYVRIYPATLFPDNRTYGMCSINMEVMVHSKINHLSNYTTRVESIIQLLIELLNGTDVGGLGVMYFDASRSSLCTCKTIGSKPYKGKVLTLGVNIG